MEPNTHILCTKLIPDLTLVSSIKCRNEESSCHLPFRYSKLVIRRIIYIKWFSGHLGPFKRQLTLSSTADGQNARLLWYEKPVSWFPSKTQHRDVGRRGTSSRQRAVSRRNKETFLQDFLIADDGITARVHHSLDPTDVPLHPCHGRLRRSKSSKVHYPKNHDFRAHYRRSDKNKKEKAYCPWEISCCTYLFSVRGF